MSEIGASIYGAMHQNVSIVDSIDYNECIFIKAFDVMCYLHVRPGVDCVRGDGYGNGWG